jgi:hypothetical protein
LKMTSEKEEDRYNRVKEYFAGLNSPVNASMASKALGIKTCTLIMLLLRHKDRFKQEANIVIDKVGGQWVIWR